MEKYKVAVNLGIISRPGQKPDFGMGLKPDQMTPWQRKTRRELTFNMSNVEATPAQIAKYINMGGTISTWHTGGKDCKHCRNRECFGRQHRANANFLEADFLGADFDNLTDAAQVLDNDFVKYYGSIISHTASSTIQKPKMRVFFLLSETVTDGPLYREMNLAMMWKLEGLADPSCKDYCRLWFGNQGADPIVTRNILPIETALELRAEWLAGPGRPKDLLPEHIKLIPKPNNGPQSAEDRRKEAFGKAVLARAVEKISAATEGNRHDTLKNMAYNVYAFVKGGVIDKNEADEALERAYPAKDRGDGPDLLEWAYENAPVDHMPEDFIKLDFTPKPAPKLNFVPKSAPKLNFGGNK